MEQLTNGYYDEVLTLAKSKACSERKKYLNILNEIKQYCIDNKLILSDPDVIANIKTNCLEPMWRIYTNNPLRHANAITNRIYLAGKAENSDIDYRLTRLKTMRAREEFVIEYDLRRVCMVFASQQVKCGVVKPVILNKLHYYPPEIELIDVYAQLSNPAYCSEYENLYLYEKRMFNHVKKRKHQGILGGSNVCYDESMIDAIKIKVLQGFVGSNKALIGKFAYNWMNNIKAVCPEKLQFVSDEDPNIILSQIQQMIKSITNFKVSFREQQLHIPKDFRTNRYTFYIHAECRQGIKEKAFMDIFTNARHELIEFTNVNGMKIASAYFQLRILFIDIWILRIIYEKNVINKAILNKKINDTWNTILYFRDKMRHLNEEAPEPVSEVFIGTHRDFALDKKISALDGKRFAPYYPFGYERSHKKLREI